MTIWEYLIILALGVVHVAIMSIIGSIQRKRFKRELEGGK
jgi:hypothetical protein